VQPTSYKSVHVDVGSQDSSVAVVMGRGFGLRKFSLLSNCASSWASTTLASLVQGAPFSVSEVAVT
jgi:hypothetical protein